MKKIILIFILCLETFLSNGQNKGFARNIIDTLSSPYFAGRGYVNDGDLKAAQFITKKFHAFHLKGFELAKDYVQPFVMPVNIFPGKMMVKINTQVLTPAKDFLVDPISGGCKRQTLELFYIDSATLKSILDGNKIALPKKKFALVFEKKALEKTFKDGFEKLNALRPSALISLNDSRLIWSISAVHIDIPFIEIKKDKYPSVAKTITLQIEEQQVEHHTQNIAGYIPGSIYPDSFLFITAHYDHLGQMGSSVYFPGANDNASGIAMMLDMAHYYSQPKNRPRYSIGFIAFAGEEAGLVGSKYYTDYPLIPLKQISFLINMDLMANGQDGIMVVNGSVFPRAFKVLQQINDSAHYLKTVSKRGKAANSDHYWFSEKGVKAIFIYLLGDYPYYHDIYDTSDKPTLAGYDGAFKLIKDFLNSYGN